MSCPREERERLEHYFIGKYGVLSENSQGRALPEPECDIRTCFQRDVDRITHSKAFRRLKHKTQVFLQPEGDHYRTRLTHTLEVSRLARTVTRALALNEDLAEAASLGHDLGHTPFGHAGESMSLMTLSIWFCSRPSSRARIWLMLSNVLLLDGTCWLICNLLL